jgi:hypothetical protein
LNFGDSFSLGYMSVDARDGVVINMAFVKLTFDPVAFVVFAHSGTLSMSVNVPRRSPSDVSSRTSTWKLSGRDGTGRHAQMRSSRTLVSHLPEVPWMTDALETCCIPDVSEIHSR